MNIRWFRDRFSDAVWDSTDLNSYEKAVAEAYSRHARNQNGEKAVNGNLAWLTYPRLMEISGIKRRERLVTVQKALVEKGWFVVEYEAPRRSTLYQLVIPTSAASSDVGTSESEDADAGGSDGGTSDRGNVESGGSDDGTTDEGTGTPASSDDGTTGDSPDQAASSDVGTSVVPFWGSGSSDVGTLPPVPKEKPLPPTPSVEASRPEPGENREGGEINSDLEKQKIQILEKVCALRRYWSRPKILAEIETALNDGRPIDLIAVAFPLVAADKQTGYPGRLSSEHPWWEKAAQQLNPPRRTPAAPPAQGAKCRECDDDRTVPNPADPAGPRVPCGCNPASVISTGDVAARVSAPQAVYLPPPDPTGRVAEWPHTHVDGLRENNLPRCGVCFGAWRADPRSKPSTASESADDNALLAEVIKLDRRRAS